MAKDGGNGMDPTKTWVMVALTAVFVALYAAALFGWLHAPADEKMITRLEPIIFAIIGYYFGRVPSAQNEKSLKDEITRQAQRGDAASNDKDKILQQKTEVEKQNSALEQKVRAAKAAMSAAAPEAPAEGIALTLSKGGGGIDEPRLRQTVAAAIRVLDA